MAKNLISLKSRNLFGLLERVIKQLKRSRDLFLEKRFICGGPFRTDSQSGQPLKYVGVSTYTCYMSFIYVISAAHFYFSLRLKKL